MKIFKKLVRKSGQAETSEEQQQQPEHAPQAQYSTEGHSETDAPSHLETQRPGYTPQLQFSCPVAVTIRPEPEQDGKSNATREQRQEEALRNWLNSKSQNKVQDAPEAERRLGLEQQFPDPGDRRATIEAEVDIIAIHGLGARSPKTWIAYKDGKSKASGEVNWLSDANMLPSVIPYARILCYDWLANYAKGASQKRFTGHADTLLNLLDLDRERTERSDRPIIFIASCFGGLLLAKSLVRAAEEFHQKAARYRRILNLTVGVVFLGTPFGGSWRFGYTNAQFWYKLAVLQGQDCSPELIQYLRDDRREDDEGRPSPLNDVIETFTRMSSHEAFKFPMICFFEELPAKYEALVRDVPNEVLELFGIDKNGQGMTVPQSSATLPGVDSLGLPVRHNLLHKHASPHGAGFRQISDYLKMYAENASDTMEKKAMFQQDLTIGYPQKLADWLQVPDYSAKQNDTSALRQPGTGQWLLCSEEFARFKTQPSQTLFCPGIYGVGKTVLTSLVIEHLAKTACNTSKTLLAYAYCDFQLQQYQTARHLLASLLKQLIKACSQVPEAVISMFKNQLQKERRQPTLDETLGAARHIAANCKKVFIVVDALDECYSTELKEFMDKVFELQGSSNISLFATSRFIPEIQQQFGRAPQLHIRGHRGDIALFLESHIQKVSSFLQQQSPQLKSDIVNAICNASDGMFLLARLYLDSLKDKRRTDEVKTALRNLKKLRRNSSEEDPLEALEQAYSKLVERIKTQGSGLWKLARQVLTWLTFARERLTVAGLKHALAVEIGAPTLNVGASNLWPTAEIVSACAGLVTLEAESGTVAFVHWTAKNYFETYLSATNAEAMNKQMQLVEKMQKIDHAAIEMHKQLALTCITYLNSKEFESGPCLNSNLLARRLRAYPFYKYASKNWGQHVRIISQNLDRETTDFIISFLKNHLKVAAARQPQLYPAGVYVQLPARKLEAPKPWGPSLPFPLAVFADRSTTGMRTGSALHIVSSFGLTSLANILLGMKYEPDSVDCLDMTPLCYAASVGEVSLIRLLLNSMYHVNPAHKSLAGLTPLCYAARNGHKDAVEVLLSLDATRSSRKQALSLAEAAGYHEVARLIMTTYINPRAIRASIQ